MAQLEADIARWIPAPSASHPPYAAYAIAVQVVDLFPFIVRFVYFGGGLVWSGLLWKRPFLPNQGLALPMLGNM